MGMEAVFATITPSELATFKEDPSLAYGQILTDMSVQLPAGLADMEGFTESMQKTMVDMQKAMQSLGSNVSKTAKSAYAHVFSALTKQSEKSTTERKKFFSLQKTGMVCTTR